MNPKFKTARTNDDPLLDVTAAAAYLTISESTLYRMTWARRIEFVRIGRGLKFRRSALDAFISLNTIQPAA